MLLHWEQSTSSTGKEEDQKLETVVLTRARFPIESKKPAAMKAGSSIFGSIKQRKPNFGNKRHKIFDDGKNAMICIVKPATWQGREEMRNEINLK